MIHVVAFWTFEALCVAGSGYGIWWMFKHRHDIDG